MGRRGGDGDGGGDDRGDGAIGFSAEVVGGGNGGNGSMFSFFQKWNDQ